MTASYEDFGRLVNVVSFSWVHIRQVDIAGQHPSLCCHGAKYVLFTLTPTQACIVVVRYDG